MFGFLNFIRAPAETVFARGLLRSSFTSMGTQTARLIAFISLIFLTSIMPSSAQKKKGLMVGTAAKVAEPANVKVVPDLSNRLSRFRSVQMPMRTDLTPNER